MSPMIFNRLLPEPGTVEVQDLLSSLDLSASAPPDRPCTAVNFVVTADGSATFQGRSGPIGDAGDRAMFHALREHVDAVLAGTGTLGVERYGRILGKAERRERRLAAGLSAEPLACVVSRSGRLPLDIPLFSEPEAVIVVFSPVPPEGAGIAATIRHEPYDGTGERPLAGVMRTLRHRYSVRSLLCEGGPSLFGALLDEQLVDELFLTLAPKLAGGSAGPTVATGLPLEELAPLRIRWLLECEDSLYLRYGLA